MFLIYALGFLVTYIGLVIFNKDSLIGRDVMDNMELYCIMLCLSLIFPITLIIMLFMFVSQRLIEFSKGRKK